MDGRLKICPEELKIFRGKPKSTEVVYSTLIALGVLVAQRERNGSFVYTGVVFPSQTSQISLIYDRQLISRKWTRFDYEQADE